MNRDLEIRRINNELAAALANLSEALIAGTPDHERHILVSTAKKHVQTAKDILNR